MKLKAFAKINLYLDVVGKRADGYHNIESLFQTIGLHDVLSVVESDNFSITCSSKHLENEDNLALIAARRFCEHFRVDRKFAVTIEKNIPEAAGLAGGSADAAGVLVALASLTGTIVSHPDLLKLAESIGADVPYLIEGGGLCLVSGRGEKVTRLPHLPDTGLVIVKPPYAVSTKEAYDEVDKLGVQPMKRFDAVGKAALSGSWEAVGAVMGNSFLAIDLNRTALSAAFFERMSGMPEVIDAGLSGSGPSLFALCHAEAAAEVAQNVRDADEFAECIVLETITFNSSVKIF